MQVKVTNSEGRTLHGRLCVMQDMTELKVWKASDEQIAPETLVREAHELAAPGTQFTCFTGTEVQILTSEELRARRAAGRAAGRAHVPHMHALHSVYLLYWYKSTYADVISGELRLGPKCRIRTRYMRGDGSSDIVSTNGQVLSLLALLVHTYKCCLSKSTGSSSSRAEVTCWACE